jgi:tungstate transport system substrate-binding protein
MKRPSLRVLFFLLIVGLLLLLVGCAAPTAEPTAAPDTAGEEAEAQPEATVEEAAAPAEEEAVAPTEVPEEEAAAPVFANTNLVLATTTSTYDSGLLDYIIPVFEEKYGVSVDVIAVGTGQALAMGEAGDADVLLVHARAREDAFVEAGDGTSRYDVMYNDFVIVGPADDPAGIQGMESAADAFAAIAASESTFVSRGDDSGTHTKEKAIWEAAGITPEGDWYLSAGQGMGAVLTMSAESQAYTLSDRATYLSALADGLDLEVMVEGDPILFNPYGVIPVNPETHPGVNIELADQFVEWLTSVETQELIGSFTVNGQALFTPDSEQWRAAQ